LKLTFTQISGLSPSSVGGAAALVVMPPRTDTSVWSTLDFTEWLWQMYARAGWSADRGKSKY